MYTNLCEKRGFPFRKTLLKLIFVTLLCIFCIHSLRNFTQSMVITNREELGKQFSSLDSRKFINNLDKIKKSLIFYYTADNLPRNIGESSIMSLNDMINQKVIVNLDDANTMSYDGETSYAKVTKLENGFLLKVNLNDDKMSDYILAYLDSYIYCDSYLCERKFN